MPVVQEGRRGQAYQYDTVACIQWLIERQCGGGEGKVLDLHMERARLAHHQANKTKLEEALLSGEVVRTEEVLIVWNGLISAARAKLLAIPQKLAHRIIHAETPTEARLWLKEAIEGALNSLGRSGLPAKVERTLDDRSRGLDSSA